MEITIKDIFEAMPARFNGDAAGDWNANIQFAFDDQAWYVKVNDGACEVAEGTLDDATATIKTATDTWIGMVTGTVDPMQAFMTGKLKVEGNIGHVMNLQDPRIFKRV